MWLGQRVQRYTSFGEFYTFPDSETNKCLRIGRPLDWTIKGKQHKITQLLFANTTFKVAVGGKDNCLSIVTESSVYDVLRMTLNNRLYLETLMQKHIPNNVTTKK